MLEHTGSLIAEAEIRIYRYVGVLPWVLYAFHEQHGTVDSSKVILEVLVEEAEHFRRGHYRRSQQPARITVEQWKYWSCI